SAVFFFSGRSRHTRFSRDWSSDVCSSDLSYGLDVTIVPGGPNVNNRIMLLSKKLDFDIAANNLQSLDAVANKVPVVAVAAIFQKIGRASCRDRAGPRGGGCGGSGDAGLRC